MDAFVRVLLWVAGGVALVAIGALAVAWAHVVWSWLAGRSPRDGGRRP